MFMATSLFMVAIISISISIEKDFTAGKSEKYLFFLSG
ncbi:hypothetical protein CSC32_1390 [Pseudomonas aeruginosa]|nr:hypothetical protein CSC32_1390 [Pseudomonas aeruginosa]